MNKEDNFKALNNLVYLYQIEKINQGHEKRKTPKEGLYLNFIDLGFRCRDCFVGKLVL